MVTALARVNHTPPKTTTPPKATAKQQSQLALLKPGDVIIRRFVVQALAGLGSVGSVYHCTDMRRNSKSVAVKIMHPSLVLFPRLKHRFMEEVRLARSVKNPGLVAVGEWFEENGVLGYSMEYLPCGDLGAQLEKRRALSIKEAGEVLYGICGAVHALHRVGIIHRDLKAENILISVEGKPKLTDFGLAIQGEAACPATEGYLVGSVDYLSPETVLCDRYDSRSDIYALGVLAYRMLAGVFPFEHLSPNDALVARVRLDPKPLIELRPDCPAALAQLVMHLMVRDPSLRMQTVSDIMARLEAIFGIAPQRRKGIRSPLNEFSIPAVRSFLRRFSPFSQAALR